MEYARSVVADQQAIRALRVQTAHTPVSSQEASRVMTRSDDVREISREGLIGSRRLGRNLEGMLKDKPKFFVPDLRVKPDLNFEPSNSSPVDAPPEFRAFVPGESSGLPVFKPGPRHPSRDVNSRDLNLSQENREKALTQAVPFSLTARAARNMFRY